MNEAKESYRLYALSGAAREQFAQFPMPRNTEVFGPTFRGEGVVRSGDIRKDPRYGKNSPHQGMPAGHLPVASYLAVPVKAHTGEVIGGLFLGNQRADVFDERAERLALGIASQASIAMTNARLFREQREREIERDRLLESERAARSEAERLGHLKDEFLATLSHELRTPLTSIQGWATVLRQKSVTPEDHARGLETIERNVRVQTQIVSDLLDMSRIISGKIHLEVQPLQIHEVVKNALESVRQAAEVKRIRLRSILDSSVGVVRGDSNRLQQVLWNLLTNAIKFTPADGRIHVVLERVNSHIEILVEDTGIGIAPEFLPYVFDRFRQADPSTTRRYGGLGLGLSIVKNLVELHGGSVRVKSPGENQGSTFIVALPVSHVRNDRKPGPSEALPQEHAPLDSIELPNLAGARILIVDDEADGRAIIARILEGQGAWVQAAATPPEAIQALQTSRFNILLSDIGMPDMDGYELIRRVRKLDPATDLAHPGHRHHGLRAPRRPPALAARGLQSAPLEAARGARAGGKRCGPAESAAVGKLRDGPRSGGNSRQAPTAVFSFARYR